MRAAYCALDALGAIDDCCRSVKPERQLQDPEMTAKRDSRPVPREGRIEIEELEGELRELRRTKDTLETSRDRYLDLYVNAPVAYVTLDFEGTIRQVNHAAVAAPDSARLHIPRS